MRRREGGRHRCLRCRSLSIGGILIAVFFRLLSFSESERREEKTSSMPLQCSLLRPVTSTSCTRSTPLEGIQARRYNHAHALRRIKLAPSAVPSDQGGAAADDAEQQSPPPPTPTSPTTTPPPPPPPLLSLLSSRLRVVLVSPRTSANVGAACRAASNFGVDDLVVVSPRCDPFDG